MSIRVILSNDLLKFILQSPFIVNVDKSHIQAINTKFYVTILSDSTFRLKASEDKSILFHYFNNEILAAEQVVEIDSVFKFNNTISNAKFKFTIYPSEVFSHKASSKKKLYCFELYNPEELTKSYMKALINPAFIILCSNNQSAIQRRQPEEINKFSEQLCQCFSSR